MEKDDKGSTLIRIGVSVGKFLLVPAYPGCPGSKAVKRSLLLLLLLFRPNDFDYQFDDAPPSSGYTPNPATPGYHADTPSPQGPYNPQTPGSAYSPYQGNPSPSPVSYQGNTRLHCLIVLFFDRKSFFWTALWV